MNMAQKSTILTQNDKNIWQNKLIIYPFIVTFKFKFYKQKSYIGVYVRGERYGEEGRRPGVDDRG